MKLKLNKTLVLTSLAAGSVLVCSSAFAQESTTSKIESGAKNATSQVESGANNATSKVSHMWNQRSMDKLSHELGLSDTQKQKVENIFQSEHQQMKDIHQNTTMSTGEKKSEYGKIREGLDTKLQSVLTPAQYEKWQNLTHQTPPSPAK